MMKKILVVAVLCLLGAAGAFADLALGINGALYLDDPSLYTAGDIGEAFRNGEGIYYGLMAEFMGKHMGLGLQFMGSRYMTGIGDAMFDLDTNLYLSAHVLGSRFIIDPTIDAGLGYIFKDWADRDLDDDLDNPIAATAYGYLGAGVGVNIWRLGLYSKFIWHFPMGPLQGSGGGGTYTLEEFGLRNYKILLGAKIILG
ncbi:MAG: hypothetical protein A2V99_08315 [Spirochaetes bacterium RBG_16_67_19]|nr:MAG: hypothetical protein A2V99_08315 [Spirochaetes bacterium RBG_16_67_19]